MDMNVKFWQDLSLHSELNLELTLNHHIALFIEQTRIEHKAYLQEISELRNLLADQEINANMIESGLTRSDKILDTLLRYQQGQCGALVKKGLHIMPYRWRRKYRKLVQLD